MWRKENWLPGRNPDRTDPEIPPDESGFYPCLKDGIAVQDEWFHQRYVTIVVIFLLLIFHFSGRTSEKRVMTCKNIAKESSQKKE